MLKFFQDNWISLSSLAIALSGGIPGLLSVWERYSKRPSFSAEIANAIFGTVSDDKDFGRNSDGLSIRHNHKQRTITPHSYQLQPGGRSQRPVDYVSPILNT